MSSEKRLILFTVVTFFSILAIQQVMEMTGMVPPPKKPPVALAKAEAEKGKVKGEADKDDDKGKPGTPATADAARPAAPAVGAKPTEKEAAKPREPAVALAKPEELVLGSTRNTGPGGYRLQLELDQKGAGVASLASSRYEAEFVEGRPKHLPLQLLEHPRYEPRVPPSLAMTLVTPRNAEVDPGAAEAAGVPAGGGEVPLDLTVWEVVRDAQGRAVIPVSKAPAVKPVPDAKGPARPADVEGQQAAFRTRVDSLGVVLTKTYRLYKGEDGFEFDLTVESPGKENAVVYKLLGPHGIPIEGEWYTGTFRDAVFALTEGTKTKVVTTSAYDIVKKKEKPERFQEKPLKYTGIENQYFAVVLVPQPAPGAEPERWDAETTAVVLHEYPEKWEKSDIGVETVSTPVHVGPNLPKTQSFRVFAGPKTVNALAPFGAEDLAAYRKSNWIPLAPEISWYVITPLLDWTYGLTAKIARAFKPGATGNYGVAIILLTMLVRLVMFPLSRKQAMSAKRMQDLQPLLKQIQEKHKDDKEAQTKETWALYNKHGVNPLLGCLPALVQLPIFVGLWQTLNNYVPLRHASFLYIQNLAAPDMLFRFPVEVPYIGNYFNLLPFVVVALMLVQTKLFSPPATTPEAESQQKIMKYMMIVMAFMFYKVPSGLGIYFITSSLWQISERLLLPKVTPAFVVAPDSGDGKSPPGGGNNGGGGRGGDGAPAKPPGRIAKFIEKVMDEASKNPTYRNLADDKSRDRDRDRGGRDGRDKGKPRARPGRRR